MAERRKRVRDYRKEEQQRNAKARRAGFTSRAQRRRAIETGKAAPVRPDLLRSPKTIAAQKAYLESPAFEYYQALRQIPPEQRARDWSDLHAKTELATYDPSRARELGVTKAQYRNAFLAAWVEGPSVYRVRRRKQRKTRLGDDLYYWLVTLNGYYTDKEYDDRYGPY